MNTSPPILREEEFTMSHIKCHNALKENRNPNACWLLLIIDVNHISLNNDINLCHIFYNMLSIIFVKSAMLHPQKILPNSDSWVTSSVNQESASIFGTKDYGMSLPIDTTWLHNRVAFWFNGISQTIVSNSRLLLCFFWSCVSKGFNGTLVGKHVNAVCHQPCRYREISFVQNGSLLYGSDTAKQDVLHAAPTLQFVAQAWFYIKSIVVLKYMTHI